MQGKVSHYPQELWEDGLELLRVSILCILATLGFELYALGQVCYKTQLAERILVDTPNTVVNEKGAQKQGESENSHIMVLVLIEGSKTFRVDHEHTDRFTISTLSLHGLSPNPKPLRACVDCWANAKAVTSIEQHTI